MSSGKPLKVGLLGLGVVGAALAQKLREDQEHVARAAGRPIEVLGAAVSSLAKERPDPGFPLTDVPEELALHPAVDVVVEVMGGVDPAFSCVAGALEAGKPVVTANKALLARKGEELFALAGSHPLECEAAVGGAVPIVRTLRQSVSGSRVTRVRGILNGTTNYILTKMEMEGLHYEEALADAQKLGYAEADPTSDVDGWDALYKGIVLGGLATGIWLDPDDCPREGISHLTAEDLLKAGALGREVKLVVEVDLTGTAPKISVGPTPVPKSDPLASLDGVTNGAVISIAGMSDLFLSGPGAGGAATATAVLGDLVAVARRMA